eukprot:8285843-Pyramimonas_sp.AAC.1
MLSAEGSNKILGRASGDRGIQLDMIIQEGWPDNSYPPKKPQKYWQGAQGALRRRVTVHVVELGFCSDFNHKDKYTKKQQHYHPLIRELECAGWNVNKQVHVVTVGARATVPLRNA